ncbi:hypothetical protein M413DRAFT_137059 [Hebeloma cylindrosporum]|uniref:Uncharacterized protein n=1 Tax=Hebeloma cylindrosporum TaxID=76867 RepID=A0A0C3CDR1_HEBCY|nr:hypothetical protein M413DRAFT_137059 [Hebeloma cylindrosporum h7]
MCEFVYVGYLPLLLDGVSSCYIILILCRIQYVRHRCVRRWEGSPIMTYIHVRLTGGGLDKNEPWLYLIVDLYLVSFAPIDEERNSRQGRAPLGEW